MTDTVNLTEEPREKKRLLFFSKVDSLNTFQCDCGIKGEQKKEKTVELIKNLEDTNSYGFRFNLNDYSDNYYDSLYVSGDSVFYKPYSFFKRIKDRTGKDYGLVKKYLLLVFNPENSEYVTSTHFFLGDTISVVKEKKSYYRFISSEREQFISHASGVKELLIDTIFGIQEFIYYDGYTNWSCNKKGGVSE